MSEEVENNDEQLDPQGKGVPGSSEPSSFSVSGMYRDWFLDYASYVILERAVPALYDGLKPVQRRILHSMKDLDDGRYNKVANIIGHTMQYHPHGDASIGDALVQIGQKDLLIDCQGNWGNTLTGDSAAAPRYIEARLSKFAHDVVFDPKTTEWQLSYDGRNKEPVFLPVKFPLLLAQGGEGIAVGLSCKVLPHNFVELIDASIACLRKRSFDLVPDFPTGGLADAQLYSEGQRGGRVRARARIRKEDAKTLIIHEIPFGTTTTSLIESIIKANEKGKIKVRHIEDNTAENAEILIHLAAGVSPDNTIDALYAFTDCEVSIAPNAVVIESDKPRFVGVNELLRISTDNTLRLLELELKIKKGELEEQWHFASLERIFIEKKVYRKIEEAETWEQVIAFIDKGLKPHVQELKRPVTEEDIVRLTEIRIKRISKYDGFKADEHIKQLEAQLAEVLRKLDHLVDHAVDYFKELKKKYGAGRERKTEIRTFDTIVATKVAVANRKLYVDRQEGFAGTGLRNFEFVGECSDIDDIIVFRVNGTMMITKVADKKFIGKGILHVGVWKKGDDRTIYHMIYQDGTKGAFYMKRFAVTGITRDKEYDLTTGAAGSSVWYFTANPDGAAEVVLVQLRPRPNLRKAKFDIDFAQMAVKGRGSKGNLLTRYMVSKITQKERGGSTLGAIPIWFDETVRRLNDTGHGRYLGRFAGDDRILAIASSGQYQLLPFALSTHFPDDAITVVKWDPKAVVSAVYWEGEKQVFQVKRFQVEAAKDPVRFITDHPDSKLTLHSLLDHAKVHIVYDKRSSDRPDEEVDLAEFIAVKGVKAIGNRLTQHKVKDLQLLNGVFIPMTPELEEVQGMLISEEEIGNLEAPEEEDLEESPMARIKRKAAAETQERHPDDPMIGKSPGKQISLGLD
ncbi:MAG TPA: DNA gyrase/topoisomerase IV subunit A [Flavobacteriales bacterium]|jgi:topoisomerase-4 subunit A|nr:DNA gyrase/topoisomerase IV subunit A [Flavobacteriales bacterium]MBK7101523.1 DNA gyrase/topoisomerase IV subunit A [Flavobacteriales bacterium]MBK7112228.1 DNA gyrase/topoisomerase IV subunit A [Flavobacteriales bacterium]MBK7618750.1 DNA gyrase/topoisomerase IV subunit A [Flavobacteriales bacterium]MBK8532422.1 DNA gyrase/topoisomerase IV subunit A [Flavobacteriales bacterium]